MVVARHGRRHREVALSEGAHVTRLSHQTDGVVGAGPEKPTVTALRYQIDLVPKSKKENQSPQLREPRQLLRLDLRVPG